MQMWGGSLAAAAAGVGLLLLVFGDRLPWARRQRKGGRWVADRALGGREVRVHALGLDPRGLSSATRASSTAAAALSQQPARAMLLQLLLQPRRQWSIQVTDNAFRALQVWIPDADPSASSTPSQQTLQGTKAVPRFAPAGTSSSGGSRSPPAAVPQWWDAPARLPQEQGYKASVSAHFSSWNASAVCERGVIAAKCLHGCADVTLSTAARHQRVATGGANAQCTTDTMPA